MKPSDLKKSLRVLKEYWVTNITLFCRVNGYGFKSHLFRSIKKVLLLYLFQYLIKKLKKCLTICNKSCIKNKNLILLNKFFIYYMF
jgi:hypothetical protein